MKFTKTLLTTAILGFSLVSFHSTAWASTPKQQFQQGVSAYKKGDYQTALKFWQPLAEQGNVDAQLNLGIIYERGYGVKKDYVEAVKWYRKAEKQGGADAQFALGIMYEYGHGVKQDYSEAVKWHRKAAEQGKVEAQFRLGFMYENEIGVKQNSALAKAWYSKACDNGHQLGCEAYRELSR